MSDTDTKEPALPIDGLKLSRMLAQINLLADNAQRLLEAFHRLAARRINLTLVTLDAADGRWRCSFCIDGEDLTSARNALEGMAEADEVISPVGTLTLFPHRSRLDLLDRVLAVFGRKALPVHAAASSASTLSLVTDYPHLDDAVRAVMGVASLPAGHAPHRGRVHVRQL